MKEYLQQQQKTLEHNIFRGFSKIYIYSCEYKITYTANYMYTINKIV